MVVRINGLKTARLRKGLTQQNAADGLGYSLDGYSKIERGKRKMSHDFIRRAAELFGCDPGDILKEVIDSESQAGGKLPPVDPKTLATIVAEARDRLASLPLEEAKEMLLALISASRKP